MAVKTKKVSVNSLVEDFDVYPRNTVSEVHVRDLLLSYRSGTTLPPIIIDEQTKIIVDGVHRSRMYRKAGVDTITVEVRRYNNRQELLLDAIALNAGHGRRLDKHDHTRIVTLCRELNIPDTIIAATLHVPEKQIMVLEARVVYDEGDQTHPSKRGFRHIYGRTLSTSQLKVHNSVRSGEAGRAARELSGMLAEGLVDMSDARTVKSLRELKVALDAALELAEVPAA